MKRYLKIDKRNSAHWHDRQRCAIWPRIRDGEAALKELPGYWGGKYVVSATHHYNAVTCLYEVHTHVFEGKDRGGSRSHNCKVLLQHVELPSEFPSEHLKAKLILFFGAGHEAIGDPILPVD